MLVFYDIGEQMLKFLHLINVVAAEYVDKHEPGFILCVLAFLQQGLKIPFGFLAEQALVIDIFFHLVELIEPAFLGFTDEFPSIIKMPLYFPQFLVVLRVILR
jgi:hypothetical protein